MENDDKNFKLFSNISNLKSSYELTPEAQKMLSDMLQNPSINYLPKLNTTTTVPIIKNENNELLKEIVVNQKEQISNQEEQISNQELIINALTSQLKSVNKTLDLLLNSLGCNSQKTQEEMQKNSDLLYELKQILLIDQMENRNNKIKKFISDYNIDAVATILQIISMTVKGS